MVNQSLEYSEYREAAKGLPESTREELPFLPQLREEYAGYILSALDQGGEPETQSLAESYEDGAWPERHSSEQIAVQSYLDQKGGDGIDPDWLLSNLEVRVME